MENINIVKAPRLEFLKPYENKWVALSANKTRVISSGDTLLEAAQRVGSQEKEEVTFMKVLPFNTGYAPHEI